uniref:Small, acid-soluble spore protein H n=1 Tax=Strongyloides papillosus TaxID=174720 RepID=A0A0N5CEE5_STREA
MIVSQDLSDLCKLKNQKCRVKRHNGEYIDAIVSEIENGKVTVLFVEEGKMYYKKVTILDFQIWNSFSLSELKNADKKDRDDENDSITQSESKEIVEEKSEKQ